MARRAFLDVFVDVLSSAMTAATTSMVLDDETGLAAQDVCIIEEGTSREEVVFVTAVVTATNTATVVRGMLSSTAVVHSKGSLVKRAGYKTSLSFPIPAIGTTYTMCIVPPKGILVRASGCLNAAITGANETITLYNKTQAITGGVITIAYDGSALGDIDYCTPTAYNEFNGTTDYLKCINSGASTGTQVYQVTCEFLCLEHDAA